MKEKGKVKCKSLCSSCWGWERALEGLSLMIVGDRCWGFRKEQVWMVCVQGNWVEAKEEWY